MPLARQLPLPAGPCRPTLTSATARPRPAIAKPAPGTADA